MVPWQGQQRDFTLKSVLKGWQGARRRFSNHPPLTLLTLGGIPHSVYPGPQVAMGMCTLVCAHVCVCYVQTCVCSHIYNYSATTLGITSHFWDTEIVLFS